MKKYNSILNLIETEIAIKFVKDTFEKLLSDKLNLIRISAPLMVSKESGLNDHLTGTEKPVSFTCRSIKNEVEIVQSLAKWKRMALSKYKFDLYQGIYTDMNAIRKDEIVDSLHSIYVDQWDWEKIISNDDRNFSYLKNTVCSIYEAIKELNVCVSNRFNSLKTNLPESIFFVSTKELELRYPNLSRKERENIITKEHKAVFIYGIGWPLSDGLAHDGRAADYDDWNLNGDIMLWFDTLECAMEISSMGIRVSKESLVKQINHKNEQKKLNNSYSKMILNDDLPQTIGGGIGQSRLCMFFLKKAHIGEVQSSIWDEVYINKLKESNINLL